MTQPRPWPRFSRTPRPSYPRVLFLTHVPHFPEASRALSSLVRAGAASRVCKDAFRGRQDGYQVIMSSGTSKMESSGYGRQVVEDGVAVQRGELAAALVDLIARRSG